MVMSYNGKYWKEIVNHENVGSGTVGPDYAEILDEANERAIQDFMRRPFLLNDNALCTSSLDVVISNTVIDRQAGIVTVFVTAPEKRTYQYLLQSFYAFEYGVLPGDIWDGSADTIPQTAR